MDLAFRVSTSFILYDLGDASCADRVVEMRGWHASWMKPCMTRHSFPLVPQCRLRSFCLCDVAYKALLLCRGSVRGVRQEKENVLCEDASVAFGRDRVRG